MKIEVLKRVLAKNDARADDLRARLDQAAVTAINLMGSPGCGKTTLLEATFARMGDRTRCAVLEGDLATTRDAERIAAAGVPAVQVLTEGGCHLDAATVGAALDKIDLDRIDCLFIENVGNLVCPANFELGEHRRVVVLSTTEGDDKPLKYPNMFRRADLVVISKTDLLGHCRFSLKRVRTDLARINPDVELMSVCAYDGSGIDAWLDWIERAIGRCPAT
ncbi:MAG: hydrogenase nickel incorporation protein HypB [bacterium]|nr:hydrogenase nickel incorporation protein HypB [bacterium]